MRLFSFMCELSFVKDRITEKRLLAPSTIARGSNDLIIWRKTHEGREELRKYRVPRRVITVLTGVVVPLFRSQVPITSALLNVEAKSRRSRVPPRSTAVLAGASFTDFP